MMRLLGYSVLGTGVFVIAGVMGSSLFGLSDETTGRVAAISALAGIVLSIYFAYWMNARGASWLNSFSQHPKIDYGIWGAILGAWGMFRLVRRMDPLNAMPLYDLGAILIAIALGALFAVRIARALDLPSFMRTTTDQKEGGLR